MNDLLPITGLVFTGGKSTRMGRPKAELILGGRTMTERALDAMSQVCREVVIITARPLEFLDFNCKIIRDVIPGQGPLGGLVTGLIFARTPWVLTAPCDVPFLKVEILRIIAQKALAARGGPRVVVPKTIGGWQPLLAAYSRDCLGPAQKLLAAGGRKMDDIRYNGAAWESIEMEVFRAVDPKLLSFFNINTPEDLETANALIRGADPDEREYYC